jgi:hypothetical protein
LKQFYGEKKNFPSLFWQILKHILIGLYISMPDVKNQGGLWGDFILVIQAAKA